MICGALILNLTLMNNKDIVTVLEGDEQAYRLDSAISNSDIGHFLTSPGFFHETKMMGGEGISSSGFRLGTALDILLTEGEDVFDEQYVVQPAFESAPSSPQQHAFVDLVVEGGDIIDAYKNCGYKVDSKTDAAIEKAAKKLYGELTAYIDFFKGVNGRIQLNQEEHDKLVQMRRSVENHPVGEVFLLEPNGETVFNQLKLRWTEVIREGLTMVLKGMMDKVIVNPSEKIVDIYDLKTTAKSWFSFVSFAIPAYGYDRQATMYVRAVKYLLISLGENPDDWTINFHIFAVQSDNRFESRVFTVPQSVFDDQEPKITKALDDINWHKETGVWNITRAAHNNGGYELYEPAA